MTTTIDDLLDGNGESIYRDWSYVDSIEFGSLPGSTVGDPRMPGWDGIDVIERTFGFTPNEEDLNLFEFRILCLNLHTTVDARRFQLVPLSRGTNGHRLAPILNDGNKSWSYIELQADGTPGVDTPGGSGQNDAMLHPADIRNEDTAGGWSGEIYVALGKFFAFSSMGVQLNGSDNVFVMPSGGGSHVALANPAVGFAFMTENDETITGRAVLYVRQKPTNKMGRVGQSL